MLTEIFCRLLGVEHVRSINSMRVSLAAPWAQDGPAWVLFGCVGLAALAALFYLRWQSTGRKLARIALAVMRALLFALLLIALADPVLQLDFTNRPRPLLWLVFDGTASMNIRDEMSNAARAQLAESVGLQQSQNAVNPSRMDYVKALVGHGGDKNLLARLQKNFQIQAFILDRPDGVSELKLAEPPRTTADPAVLIPQLNARCQTTAIGSAFQDLSERLTTSDLAGIVMFSDFGNNEGPAPAGTPDSPVQRLGVPVYTVGVGPESAVELATELDLPRQLKKAERQEIKVVLRQLGLDGQIAKLTLQARRKIDGQVSNSDMVRIGSRDIKLSGSTVEERFDYVPQQAGEFQFAADVERLPGQSTDQGNHARRDATVIDDFLRLMYVEYEPTWEWRFIKEVFHRDPLVGMRGFRTFLRSSDPDVRTSNPLFLASMVPKRSEFLANDVILLGDMPASALSDRFCGLAREFVTQFGGGLVVIAGPRFGPAQLAGTRLADILPVVVDPLAKTRDDRPFHMQLTLDSARYKFMQLGDAESSDDASRRAWDNMGELPWYQPVKWAHPLATVLAEHPTDLTADGKSHQPLIAIREFPSGGRVVYLAFNETWRLRRKYGELFYRQFWGQLIQYIGLSNHIGLDKRFVVATDKLQYAPDDRVRLTVQAYDANFEPLAADKLPGHSITAELMSPSRSPGGPAETETLHISERRRGTFEIEFPVSSPGGYRVRVRDPITAATKEIAFRVVNLSPEQLTVVRNSQLQDAIAAESHGRSYDLTTVNRLPNEIDLRPVQETTTKVLALWSTWPFFLLVVSLMLTEWLCRKRINLL